MNGELPALTDGASCFTELSSPS